MKEQSARPVDSNAERCGHNFEPTNCPHEHCGYREANARIEELLAAITKHHSQHADDLCWMDDDELYAVAGLPARDATVGDPRAMLKNCKRFIRQRCTGEGSWKSYAELEADVRDLKAEVERLRADKERLDLREKFPIHC